MCGIAGYTGPKEADSVLTVALERLKYRGYDSAGLAVLSDGDVAAEPGLWFLGMWSRPSLIGYTSTQAERVAARIARAIAESQRSKRNKLF